jgi:DNA invertase Pin-like site-specific DNA recombinase
MQEQTPVPAAQYLRMSTEHQQYSLANQADAISEYARINGFEVIRTYDDAGKSGLLFKQRKGLCALLNDVIQG